MQAFPETNNVEIEQALAVSAVDLGTFGPDNVYGNGLMDIYGAYQLLASNYCSGDLDHNHLVDSDDLTIFINDWLNPSCSEQQPCRADLNNDYKIDFLDFATFAHKILSEDCL